MLILITTAIISVYRNIVNAEHIGFVMNGVASFSVQGAQQLRKQKRSTVFLCFPIVNALYAVFLTAPGAGSDYIQFSLGSLTGFDLVTELPPLYIYCPFKTEKRNCSFMNFL